MIANMNEKAKAGLVISIISFVDSLYIYNGTPIIWFHRRIFLFIDLNKL